ncbi:ferredoxin-NADP reductase [Candidatus Phycosocius bacilliformis]|uniref:ferredoxin--NADP(+) reductase n=1 Tax=Candidatus Phycosocius bacilliformis TaxID=1445552 RepID=A0A2P2EB35_9PROT|nr:ferredoxin--NADP reductase [Candidatus Phycosocius bacilliformis]GBF58264.1 ferredoxin-NADP reductase [Candidatus Phycosocius bacilliformis]
MSAFTTETVLDVQHYTDRLFRFRTTRAPAFRFRTGEFVMMGLEIDGKPLVRAYSIASPNWDEELEFYSIKVPDGPLTSKLCDIVVGDHVLVGRKPVGTLVLDALLPGKRVYMVATGTGIAPFASLIRDPETYERFEQVILTHTCRNVDELAYGIELVASLKEDPLVGEYIEAGRLIHDTSATREPHIHQGRLPARVSDGSFFSDHGLPPFNPEEDRGMICGSMDMLNSCKSMFEQAGFTEGSVSQPGQFVYEKAFVG